MVLLPSSWPDQHKCAHYKCFQSTKHIHIIVSALFAPSAYDSCGGADWAHCPTVRNAWIFYFISVGKKRPKPKNHKTTNLTFSSDRSFQIWIYAIYFDVEYFYVQNQHLAEEKKKSLQTSLCDMRSNTYVLEMRTGFSSFF